MFERICSNNYARRVCAINYKQGSLFSITDKKFKYEDQLFGINRFRVERPEKVHVDRRNETCCYVRDDRTFDAFVLYHSLRLCPDVCLCHLYVLCLGLMNLAYCLDSLGFCRPCV